MSDQICFSIPYFFSRYDLYTTSESDIDPVSGFKWETFKNNNKIKQEYIYVLTKYIELCV